MMSSLLPGSALMPWESDEEVYDLSLIPEQFCGFFRSSHAGC